MSWDRVLLLLADSDSSSPTAPVPVPVHNGGWLKRFSSQEMHFHLAAEVTANELLVFVHFLLQLHPPPPASPLHPPLHPN